jgi:hypothetical protein
MLRRSTRLRREYLYRKSLEGKERSLYEKKRKIKQALAGLFVCLFFFFSFPFLQLCENSIVVSEGKLVYASLEILFFLF